MEIADVPDTWDIRGATVGYFGTEENFMGAFSVADNSRPEAAEALDKLKVVIIFTLLFDCSCLFSV